ncbi:MAG: hypothetical protein OEV42_11285 [Deltaproteobacteria bacterium]|nr:hypothetical protein [Deltaproteobacteria bacterium]
MKRKSNELGIMGQFETCILSLVATTGFIVVIAIPLMTCIAG